MNFQSHSYGAPASNFESSQRTRVHLCSLRVGRGHALFADFVSATTVGLLKKSTASGLLREAATIPNGEAFQGRFRDMRSSNTAGVSAAPVSPWSACVPSSLAR